MKICFKLFFLFLCTFNLHHALAQSKSTVVSRIYSGKLGTTPISFLIKETDSKLSGYYYYDQVGQPIMFSGERSPSKKIIQLTAYVLSGEETFLLNQEEDGYEGKWTGNNKTLPVSLTFSGKENTMTVFSLTDSMYLRPSLTESPMCHYDQSVTWPAGNDQQSVFLRKELMKLLDPEKQVNVTWMPGILESLKTSYFDEYKGIDEDLSDSEIEEFPQGFSRQSSSSIEIEFLSDKLAVIHHSSYTYEGGAHGGSYYGYVNLDLQQKKSLSLETIFTAQGIQKLPSLLENKFRKDNQLSATASLQEADLFEDHITEVAQEFCLTPKGILFLYNQYEIAPYARGQVEIFLSYASLQSYLQPAFKPLITNN